MAVKLITRIHGVPVTSKAATNANRLSNLRNQIFTQSLIQLWASSESKIGKIRNIIEDQNNNALQTKNEVLIAEVDVTGRVDFMDGYHH